MSIPRAYLREYLKEIGVTEEEFYKDVAELRQLGEALKKVAKEETLGKEMSAGGSE